MITRSSRASLAARGLSEAATVMPSSRGQSRQAAAGRSASENDADAASDGAAAPPTGRGTACSDGYQRPIKLSLEGEHLPCPERARERNDRCSLHPCTHCVFPFAPLTDRACLVCRGQRTRDEIWAQTRHVRLTGGLGASEMWGMCACIVLHAHSAAQIIRGSLKYARKCVYRCYHARIG